MPTSPPPAEGRSPAEDASPAVPTSVRVAVIVMAVLAALLLLNAALLWYQYDVAVDRIVREADVTRDEARQFVLLSLVPNLILGLLLALSAWFLPRGRRWARWTGVVAAAVLGLLTLFQILVVGGITIPSLLLLVLSVGAVSSLLARSTGAHLPQVRGRA